jgi:hypothetical protein
VQERARRGARGWARFAAAWACGGALPALALSAPSCGGDSFTTGDGGATADGTAAADGTAGDAGVLNPEGGAADAGSFEGGDVASPADVAAVDAAPTGWCAGQPAHTFCEDFDGYQSVSTLLGSWSSFEQMNGNFKLDTAAGAPSPPNALEAIGASGAKVIVLKTLPVAGSPTRLRLEFDLRIDSPGNVGFLSAVGVAAIAFGSSINDGYAALAIGNGPVLQGAWVDAADGGASDAGSFKSSNSSGPFPASGVWAGRYAIEIDYSAATGCVQIFDGSTALLSSCLVLPPGLRHPTSVSVVLGDYAAALASTGSIDVEFDNVTFDLL